MTETTTVEESTDPKDQAYQAFLKSSGHTDSRNLKEAFGAGYEAGSNASSSGGASEVPEDLNR